MDARKNCLWTHHGARLQLFAFNAGKPLFNWLFLPGGPGLGSESLKPLTSLLNLPGASWYLDLPGDGSNLTSDDAQAFSHWSEALVEAVAALERVILVGHSTGGMYGLATAQLEKMLAGLVLMDSSPDCSWSSDYIQLTQQHPISGIDALQKAYHEHPDNEILKTITLHSLPHAFTAEGLKKDLSFMESLPYNFRSCNWSAQHFDQTYQAKWVPRSMPALIFAGEEDRITPLYHFLNSAHFRSPNILIRKIEKAAHFPWIENPKGVVEAFDEYLRLLEQTAHAANPDL